MSPQLHVTPPPPPPLASSSRDQHKQRLLVSDPGPAHHKQDRWVELLLRRPWSRLRDFVAMAIPFLGRLRPYEYFALVGSFLLVGLEAVIRVLTLALPISTSVRDAADFVELCRIWGYEAEEHIAQTKDGYLLGLHRLQWRKGEEGQKVNCGSASLKKRVIYMHHGLLMNSEVWVSLTDEQRCLPFELVERGFDVWFGNNRGNKYSKKSIHHSPTSLNFWDFSIDEFAFHDIPDSIGYILDTTQQESLSYIGFSQGTAQAFASLAIHPKLNNQVNVFIALAPAMAPAGLSNGIVDSLVTASPSVLFLLFGRRSILSSATMWETLLYPPIFSKLIDMGLSFLFNWQTKNISASQKLAAYPHLYSFTSTKSVVHWFQIIRNKCFQMYDDDVHQPMSVSTTSKYSKVAKYPTRNIKTPVVLVYGGSDSLVDIKVMLKELPPQTVATEIPHYEHLDFLWARDVDAQVFQHVFDALESFTDAEHTKEEYDRYYVSRQESLLGSGCAFGYSPRGSESESSTLTPSVEGVNGSQLAPQPHQAREQTIGIPSPMNTTRLRVNLGSGKVADGRPRTPDLYQGSRPSGESPSPSIEGRETPTAIRIKNGAKRRGSNGSNISLDSMRGISVGASKIAGGVVTKSGVSGTAAADDGRGGS
ncbi:lysosomal acid lipase cholesteryl ester hydrolase [Fusarium albosuccineum]|uniref:Lysosomal acid lipase cholesteryl ester hydrolase n=1 Tax=Fusarium albosuccineum TaxID=1237068 RepID=A0A8H4LGM8_9HYPO|nr:lysosomal acid lipase cholesteryl ester hydrolase [Fusarium albosuccineum]